MKALLGVPAAAPYFEGHFPGRPILPGVVELLLALQALAGQAAHAAALQGIAFARWRQPVAPGDVLQVDAREPAPGRLRIELARAGAAVASAELIVGHPHAAAHWRAPCATPMPLAPPALDALLPHRPPMRFILAVEGESARALHCRASIPAASGLTHEATAPMLCAVEAAAQAAAAWEALRRWRAAGKDRTQTSPPRIGYLVALRDIAFFATHLAAERAFSVAVSLEAAAAPLAHYRFEAATENSPLARGFISTFLA